MNYIPNTYKDRTDMMQALGINSIDELFADIPEEVKLKGSLKLPSELSELQLRTHVKSLSEKNADLDELACFIGAGSYDHYIPSAVTHIIGRSEFSTAYTPYQPEISQGTLHAMFEFQSLISELTSMDVVNASLYDGATALVEAVHLCCEQSRNRRVLVSKTVHPEYRQVLVTYAKALRLELVEIDHLNGTTDLNSLQEYLSEKAACVIMQNPNFFGLIEEMQEASQIAHKKGALFVSSVYPVSLGILARPGDYDADVVVGEGQSLGIPMSFGGPYLGLFACRKEFIRRVPGRVVGMTSDRDGKTCFVLTLQTREQHIRRQRATSNICSNQALCALASTVYLSCLGSRGLKKAAELCLYKSHYLAEELSRIKGFTLKFKGSFFNEFVIEADKSINIELITKKLLDAGIVGGLLLHAWYPDLSRCLMFCVTEKRTRKEMDTLIEVLREFSI